MKRYKTLKKKRICLSAKIDDKLLYEIFSIKDRSELNTIDGTFILKGGLPEFERLVNRKVPCKTIIKIDGDEYLRLFDGVREGDYRAIKGKTVLFREQLQEIKRLMEDDNDALALVRINFLTLDEDIGEMDIGGQIHHAKVIRHGAESS